MDIKYHAVTSDRSLIPWNKGKVTGAKPPLRPKQVWAIRTRLQIAGRIRDLALFNMAIDSKLRGCDLVRLKIKDVAPHGYVIDRTTILQKKTGRPVKFELTEQTRSSVDDLLAVSNRGARIYLFPRRCHDRHLTTRQYARLLSEWLHMIGLDPALFGTHSLRRRYTARREISGQSNCFSAIPGSRAPFDISGSR